jgi:hypothetical protein
MSAAKYHTKRLLELVGQKQKAEIETADPIYLAAAIVENVVGDVHQKMLAEVAKMADQIAAATNVLAETTAKARAESVHPGDDVRGGAPECGRGGRWQPRRGVAARADRTGGGCRASGDDRSMDRLRGGGGVCHGRCPGVLSLSPPRQRRH